MTKLEFDNFAAATLSGPVAGSAASRPPSMRAIAAFEAAARHENFAKAAEELNLSQSAVSHSIRALEEQFGVQLFARRGRYVTITQDGAWLAQRLRATLAQVSDAVGALLAAQGRATVTVEVVAGLAARPVLKAWAAAGLDPAQARLEVRTLAPGEVPGATDADLVISEAQPVPDRTCARPVSFGQIIAVATAAVAARDPSAWDIIEGPGRRLEAWRARSGLPALSRPPTLRAATDALALDAVKAGLGVGFFPRALVLEELGSGLIVRLELAEPAPDEICWAAWRPTAPSARYVESLVDRLVSPD